MLMQGRLVRINRSTFELEPWLAERWESSADGRTHTLHLRQGVVWSDGTPFTSADVLFSLRAAYDPNVKSVVASSLMVGGQPIEATAPDDATVVLTYAAPSGPGVRLLDMLPILPRHKLEAALSVRNASPRPGEPARRPARSSGPVRSSSASIQPGQRLVFDRNPRYWRKAPNGDALPYLDRLVLELVPDQNAELLRLQSGATDLTHSELRSDDYIPVRRAEEEGKLTMVELGVGPDADAFWFCLKPEKKAATRASPSSSRREFRQAISHAVDREAFAQTVFLGEAVPIWGPITPGNRLWFSPNVPRYPLRCRPRARAAQGHRPRGPQRQRRCRRQRRDRSALHGDHAAGHRLLRARHDGPARTGGRGRHRARHRSARVLGDGRRDCWRATTTRSTCAR